MAERHQASVYTIAAGASFLDALAAGLDQRYGGEDLGLSRVMVLLPTRRACRALGEAFLRLKGGAPLLLPAMRPIGDVEADEMDLGAEVVDSPLTGAVDEVLELPPAIPPISRQLLLSRLILTLDDSRGQARHDPALAAQLAAELGRLLDQVQTERLGFAKLAELVPEDYAAHWQITLDFLKILTEHWPKMLAERGCSDPAQRRNRLIEVLAARWRHSPPAEPVIAAGSTGSIPATAELLGVVAKLPQGAVVLPALDCDMDQQSWDRLDPVHPQFGMKQLLMRMDVERAEVAPWPVPEIGGAEQGRVELIAEAMRPAATTETWREVSPPPPAALEGVVRIDAPGPQEEAGIIALTMREALEVPGRTAALITPDRRLARRVASELGRWGIHIDDSGGRPLSDTAPGTLLRLSAEMVAERAAPVPLLAVLKHPLAAGGTAPAAFRANVRALERLVLRGPRPGPGLDGLLAAVKAMEGTGELKRWLGKLARAAAPFAEALAATAASLPELLERHVAFAEWLAADAGGGGAARLWAGEAGEACAVFVAELAQAAPMLAPIPGAAYPALLEELMHGRVVRPRYGLHPRLNIWGLLEARLQQADVLVLGGLNEGHWPAEAAADPWLSRPMRARFGLPAPERRIGLSAHDFAQAACARRVVLTRAAKVEGTPTVPSRWLLRLDNLLKACGREWPKRNAASYLHWQGLLDHPDEIKPNEPPEPRPPVEARPRRLPVTQVETWMRDPYAIYARHILNLKALDPLDADPGAAERGQAVHKALDSFLREVGEEMPPDAYERLLAHGRAAFGAVLERPGVRAFWWPRFERIAAWFLEQEHARRQTCVTLATEVQASLALPGPAGPFTLTAKADRIDRLDDGALAIIDYKTGALPLKREVERGMAPQLPLEAMLAQDGAFAGIAPAEVRELAFWRLSGGEPPGEIRRLNLDPAAAAEEAREGLARLIAAFDEADTPYLARPKPEAAPRYSDYEHLARVKEWSAGSGGEGR